jgi:beta-lactamase superfamily II metal-dependent hydrolase
LGSIMMLPSLALVLAAAAVADTPVVHISFLDVGQGDATVIDSPDGKVARNRNFNRPSQSTGGAATPRRGRLWHGSAVGAG